MKNRSAMFSITLRMFGVLLILQLMSVGAQSQNAAPAVPDGMKARNILNLQIHHATISVADIQTETNWYIQTLGFSFPSGSQGPQKINPKLQGVRLVIPGFQLDLIQYEGSQRPKAPSPVFMQQGYIHLVFTASDLDAALGFLQAAGTDVTGNRNREGKLGSIVLHDPEGNEIEISSR